MNQTQIAAVLHMADSVNQLKELGLVLIVKDDSLKVCTMKEIQANGLTEVPPGIPVWSHLNYTADTCKDVCTIDVPRYATGNAANVIFDVRISFDTAEDSEANLATDSED